MGMILETFIKYYVDDTTGEIIGDLERGDICLLLDLDNCTQEKTIEIEGFDCNEIDIYIANYIIQSVEEDRYIFQQSNKEIIFESLLEVPMKITFKNSNKQKINLKTIADLKKIERGAVKYVS